MPFNFSKKKSSEKIMKADYNIKQFARFMVVYVNLLFHSLGRSPDQIFGFAAKNAHISVIFKDLRWLMH